jgi:hypothetical protein
MSHEIKLNKFHKKVLGEVLYDSLIYKRDVKLRNPESIAKMEEEYCGAVRQIVEDDIITCGKTGTRPKDNFFGWIKDQILHSGKLANSEWGQLAISICEAAGENRYEQFNRTTIINRLFE